MRASRVVVLLLLLAGCSGGGSTAGGVVPWLNRPLPLYVVPEPKVVPYPTSAPACRAAHLWVARDHTAAGLGNLLEEVVFTNLGARPCLLRGYPSISAEITAGGRQELR